MLFLFYFKQVKQQDNFSLELHLYFTDGTNFILFPPLRSDEKAYKMSLWIPQLKFCNDILADSFLNLICT